MYFTCLNLKHRYLYNLNFYIFPDLIYLFSPKNTFTFSISKFHFFMSGSLLYQNFIPCWNILLSQAYFLFYKRYIPGFFRPNSIPYYSCFFHTCLKSVIKCADWLTPSTTLQYYLVGVFLYTHLYKWMHNLREITFSIFHWFKICEVINILWNPSIYYGEKLQSSFSFN